MTELCSQGRLQNFLLQRSTCFYVILCTYEDILSFRECLILLLFHPSSWKCYCLQAACLYFLHEGPILRSKSKKVFYGSRPRELCTIAASHKCRKIIKNKNHKKVINNIAVKLAVAAHSSTLAWKIPWTEKPAGLQSMGSLRVRHD